MAHEEPKPLEGDHGHRYTIKLSEDKHTLPGAKQIFRYPDHDQLGRSVECPSCHGGPRPEALLRAGNREHYRGALDARHRKSGEGQMQSDASGAARQIKNWPAGFTGLREIELDVTFAYGARAASLAEVVELDARYAILIVLG